MSHELMIITLVKNKVVIITIAKIYDNQNVLYLENELLNFIVTINNIFKINEYCCDVSFQHKILKN